MEASPRLVGLVRMFISRTARGAGWGIRPIYLIRGELTIAGERWGEREYRGYARRYVDGPGEP